MYVYYWCWIQRDVRFQQFGGLSFSFYLYTFLHCCFGVLMGSFEGVFTLICVIALIDDFLIGYLSGGGFKLKLGEGGDFWGGDFLILRDMVD